MGEINSKLNTIQEFDDNEENFIDKKIVMRCAIK